jgi:hypothetical protein
LTQLVLSIFLGDTGRGQYDPKSDAGDMTNAHKQFLHSEASHALQHLATKIKLQKNCREYRRIVAEQQPHNRVQAPERLPGLAVDLLDHDGRVSDCLTAYNGAYTMH